MKPYSQKTPPPVRDTISDMQALQQLALVHGVPAAQLVSYGLSAGVLPMLELSFVDAVHLTIGRLRSSWQPASKARRSKRLLLDLASFIGELPARSVTGVHILAYFDEIKRISGAPPPPYTRQEIVALARDVLETARVPFPLQELKVALPLVRRDDLFLAPQELRELFLLTTPEDWGNVALLSIAAIPFTFLERLDDGWINFEERRITVPPAACPGWRPRQLWTIYASPQTGEFLEAIPPALWPWLRAHAPRRAKPSFRERIVKISPRWQRDTLYHTAVAMCAAQYGVRPAARLWGEPSIDSVRNRFAGRVTPADAAKLYSMNPVTLEFSS